MAKKPSKPAATPAKTARKTTQKAATKKPAKTAAKKATKPAAKAPAARGAGPLSQAQFDQLMATPMSNLTLQHLVDIGLANTEPNKINPPPGPALLANSVLSDADIQRIAVALQALLGPR